jgi:hypothetical protein
MSVQSQAIFLREKMLEQILLSVLRGGISGGNASMNLKKGQLLIPTRSLNCALA